MRTHLYNRPLTSHRWSHVQHGPRLQMLMTCPLNACTFVDPRWRRQCGGGLLQESGGDRQVLLREGWKKVAWRKQSAN